MKAIVLSMAYADFLYFEQSRKELKRCLKDHFRNKDLLLWFGLIVSVQIGHSVAI